MQPGFTATAVLILGLGIGANSAMFSLINAVLIRPLPYENPDRVVRLVPDHAEYGESDRTFSYADLEQLRQTGPAFDGIAAQAPWSPHLRLSDETVLLHGAAVSGEYFRVLGVRPEIGRFFGAAEAEPGSARAVVLGHALWIQHFGGDSTVVGTQVRLGESSYVVVGVTPPDFEDPRLDRTEGRHAPEIWSSPPGYWTEGEWAEPGTRFLTAVARLGSGVTLTEAEATAGVVMTRLEAEFPGSHSGWGIRLVPLRDDLVAPVRPALMALFAAVGLVLLIACANLANLLFVRGIRRRRELAVRVALGGSQRSIVRLLLTESVVIGLAGGAFGLLLAWFATDAIVALGAGRIPRLTHLTVNARVIGFTLIASLVTGMVFGLVPALSAARMPPVAAIKGGIPVGSSRRGLSRTVVAVEVALTLVLLVAAGLVIRSLSTLYAVDSGITAEGVLTMELSPPSRGYGTDELVHGLYDRILAEIAAVPGTQAAGATNVLAFSGGYWRSPFHIEGDAIPEPRQSPTAEIRTASPGFFEAMGMRLLRGRGVAANDRTGAPPVVVINEALAARYFSERDPLGGRLLLNEVPHEVVGLVADVRQFGLDRPAEPTMYLSLAQSPSWLTRNAAVVVRSRGDPGDVAPGVLASVREVAPDVPVSDVRPMEDLIADTVVHPRFRATLFGLFAVLALALAATGVYGVIAHGVAERRRELALRIAIGARWRDLVRDVVWGDCPPLAAGLAIGLAGALAVGRVLESMLFEISAWDPATVLAAVGIVVGMVIAASLVPLRRAARIDPMEALRHE